MKDASRPTIPLDPDIPIPSLEDPTQVTVDDIIEERVMIKEENSDETDLYSIPELYRMQQDMEDGNDDDDTSHNQEDRDEPVLLLISLSTCATQHTALPFAIASGRAVWRYQWKSQGRAATSATPQRT